MSWQKTSHWKNRKHDQQRSCFIGYAYDAHQNFVAQQQNSSGGHGFWSHVSNLLHGHSWNYGMRERVTVTIGAAKPNDAVALGADAAGLVAATPGVSAMFGIPLGGAASAVSISNDPHNTVNTGINITGQVLGGISAVGEGTAVGSAAAGAGFGLAYGAFVWDLDNAFVNHVLMPMAGKANYDPNAPPAGATPYDYDPDIP